MFWTEMGKELFCQWFLQHAWHFCVWGSPTVIHRTAQELFSVGHNLLGKLRCETEVRKRLVVVLTIGTNSTNHKEADYRISTEDESHPQSSVIPHPLPSHLALVFYSPLGLPSSKIRIMHLWEIKNTTEFWANWTWKCFLLSQTEWRGGLGK